MILLPDLGDSDRTAITPATLAAFYPEVRRRAAGALARRGTPVQDIEDLVAEAFACALAQRVRVRDLDDFAGWIFTVAWRRHVDEIRQAQRRQRCLLYEREATDDVTVSGALARVTLDSTMHAINALPDGDRTLVLAGLTGWETPADRRAAVWSAVRRHRLRRRLLKLLGPIAAVVVACRAVLAGSAAPVPVALSAAALTLQLAVAPAPPAPVAPRSVATAATRIAAPLARRPAAVPARASRGTRRTVAATATRPAPAPEPATRPAPSSRPVRALLPVLPTPSRTAAPDPLGPLLGCAVAVPGAGCTALPR